MTEDSERAAWDGHVSKMNRDNVFQRGASDYGICTKHPKRPSQPISAYPLMGRVRAVSALLLPSSHLQAEPDFPARTDLCVGQLGRVNWTESR